MAHFVQCTTHQRRRSRPSPLRRGRGMSMARRTRSGKGAHAGSRTHGHAPRLIPVRAVFASAILSAACSSSSADRPASAGGVVCPAVVQQPLVNGASQETYLGLAQTQILAIVQIVDATAGAQAAGPRCSGTFVTPDWVVTAGHCLQIQTPVVVVAAGPQTSM